MYELKKGKDICLVPSAFEIEYSVTCRLNSIIFGLKRRTTKNVILFSNLGMIMMSRVLSFYKKSLQNKSFQDMHSTWQLVNPSIEHWNRFKFFITKYYYDENRRDLIIALNPGRKGCNKTGIALTDENVLFTKLKYPNHNSKPEVERTATRIYSIIEEVHPNINTFFSKFFMMNIFPFGVVTDGKNVVFNKIIKIPKIEEFSKDFVAKSIEIFNPERIFCVGRGSKNFIQNHFSDKNPVYLYHPAYRFPDKEKEKYRKYLK